MYFSLFLIGKYLIHKEAQSESEMLRRVGEVRNETIASSTCIQVGTQGRL